MASKASSAPTTGEADGVAPDSVDVELTHDREDVENKPSAADGKKGKKGKTDPEVRALKQQLALLERKNKSMAAESKNLNAQLARALLGKERMEQLCRELKRQLDVTQTEHKRAMAEEKKRYTDLTTKCQDMIKDVSERMDKHGEDSEKVVAENEALRQQIETLSKHVEAQKAAFDMQLKTKDLECQLAEAKYAQQLQIATEETAISRKCLEELKVAKESEALLKEQVELYSSKMDGIQDTLKQSNAAFTEFRKHREMSDKAIKSLTKERDALLRKSKQAEAALVVLTEKSTTTDEALGKLTKQRDQFQALCRQLQAERTALQKQVDELTGSAGSDGAKGSEAGISTVSDADATPEDK